MANPLPHSAAIKQEISDYLSEAVDLIQQSAASLKADGYFNSIYRTTLATTAVLKALSGEEKPGLAAASAVVERVPLHVLLTQIAAAEVELRRLIELTFLTVYFTDHRIEWAHFERTSGEGIVSGRETPIACAAHREPSYYANYTKELLECEPSGIALDAARTLAVTYGNLSSSVHAAAASLRSPPLTPIETPTQKVIAKFASDYRLVAANSIAVLAAFRRTKFDQLQPTYRAWFDWLQGPMLAKRIRSGRFGLN